MTGSVQERHVTVAGGRCRLLEKGDGPIVGVIGGHNGIPGWTPFLEALSATRRVCVISPPGFPGSDAHHENLDDHLDWLSATLDLLQVSGVAGGDLLAASVGAMLAADAAAMCPGIVRRLSLVGPYGLYTADAPVLDFYAQTSERQRELLCADADLHDAAFGAPEDAREAADHELMLYRAATAAARITWPFGDRGLNKRLHRISVPVQLLWGEEDQIVPGSHARLFSDGLAGPVDVTVIAGAGHLVWIDRPRQCADAVEAFLSKV